MTRTQAPYTPTRMAGLTNPTSTGTIRRTARRAVVLGAFAAFLIATATGVSATGGGHGQPCNCQPNTADAKVVEWDVPSEIDTRAGAIVVDVHGSHSGRLWFVSRNAPVKLYRLEPGKPIDTKAAKWKSFELNPFSVTTGGLKRIKVTRDDRYAFVRTQTSIQRIATEDCHTNLLMGEMCERITYDDRPGALLAPQDTSDLTTDGCNVYTASALIAGVDPDPELLPSAVLSPDDAYVQQLSPCRNHWNNATSGTTDVKRWKVGGSAGFCPSALDSAPCLSGVTVDPKREYLVYFSQPGDNKLGELDVRTNKVRRWSLASLGTTAFPVFEPRQLDFDDDGTVWTVTGSGHVVRLDPKKNRASAHLMPSHEQDTESDAFGVAPDHGVIGYTNASTNDNRVAMVMPKGNTKPVYPDTKTVYPVTVPVNFTADEAPANDGTVLPKKKTVHADITDKNDGFFVEARVGGMDTTDNDSFNPLGITADLSKKVGTYFYAVGSPGMGTLIVNRVGQVVLPFKNRKHGHARDDDDHDRDGKRDDQDDDDDNDGRKDHEDDDDDDDCIRDYDDDDDDNDGIEDKDDRKDRKETRHTREEESVAAGQSADYPMEVGAGNLLLVATATAADPSALMSVEVYNPAGQLVSSSLPSPGVAIATVPTLTAGNYTVRVRNLGLTPTAMSTGFLAQATWPIEPLLP